MVVVAEAMNVVGVEMMAVVLVVMVENYMFLVFKKYFVRVS